MAIKIERIKALTLKGLVSKAEEFCNTIEEDKIISVSASFGFGETRVILVTYKA